MTQEYSPDDYSVGAVDDSAPAPTASPVYGPPTTVASKRRPPARTRGARRLSGVRSVSGASSASRPLGRAPHRSPLAFFGDSRGLTFLGALILATVVGTVGGVISAGTRGWVGTVFTVCFVSGCVLAAVLAHREDLVTVAFMPPVLFVAIAMAVGVTQAILASTPILKKAKFQVGYAMSFGAKTMWIATAATAVAALVMFFVRTMAARRRQAPPVVDGPEIPAV